MIFVNCDEQKVALLSGVCLCFSLPFNCNFLHYPILLLLLLLFSFFNIRFIINIL